MRGILFWKFFFAFWLALLVAGVGVGSAVWWRHRDDTTLIHGIETHRPARTIVAAAYSTYTHSGFAAFHSVLKEWSQQEDVPLFAVDDKGTELLGRNVETQVVAQARVMFGSGRYNDVMREVVDEHGRRYLLFVPVRGFLRPPMPPPPDVTAHVPTPTDIDVPAPPTADGFSTLHQAMRAFNMLERGPFPPGPPRKPTPWVPILSGLIASVLFSAFAAWSLSKPIRVLRSGFTDVAAGRFDTNVAQQMGTRGDELAVLGADFDSMARQLRVLIDAQQRLLHDVSHELRSPLARLQAAVGLARQQPNRSADMLNRIELECGRLDALVGELLMLSRLEAGVPSSMEERINIDEIIASVVADAQFEAEPKHVRIELEGRSGAVVVGQRELLARAIENVIRNAIHYSPPGLSAWVCVTSDSGYVVVRITDCGPGVKHEDIASIFKPFFRSDLAHGGEGYGLGLAIARRAVEAHGGSIVAANREGGGLSVEIRLPISDPSLAIA